MANYTIYVLDESDLTVNNPDGLDGVNQGDGSHLNGKTLTINAANWTPIAVRDNDVNFEDNDSSQRLDGAQEVDGTVYSDGTRLEAEFSFEGTYDGVTYKFIAFNVVNSNPSYGTIEGLAVVGPDGSFPPVGVPIALSNAREGPRENATDYVAPICFDAGCPILTPEGYRSVETLRAGDLVTTLDDGPQPILWIGSRRAFGVGPFAPVQIAPGALGNERTLRLSQQHRLLIRDARADLFFGESEVLVPARALLGMPGVSLAPGHRVHYHHLLLPDHAILDCAGLPAESFLPNAYGLSLLSEPARASLKTVLTPETRAQYRPARPILRNFEAQTLRAA